MTKFIWSVLSLTLLLWSARTQVINRRLVCYYDASSSLRTGSAQFRNSDLEFALQFCTHLIYGYAGLKPTTFEITSLNVDLDMFHYKEVTSLKAKFPQLKVLLSVGGDKDVDEANPLKYVYLLESGRAAQQNFIDSSITLLRNNGFDGLDLAFQLPRNKPRKVHSWLGMYWKKFKKLFTGDFVVDPQAATHKQQYTEFVQNLGYAYQISNLTLTMTVLPNVNSSWYFDVAEIQNKFAFINLAAFDFLTPVRNPEEADYTAPIYLLDEQDRLPHYNIEYQVDYWLHHGCPGYKLNLGIASYGQAWKLTIASGFSGMPVVPNTGGPSGVGIISWPDICIQFPNSTSANYRGANAPLRKVSDLERAYGTYALRPADERNEHGVWISFDDPDFAGAKATYVKGKRLGGVALYDLSFDDFRGVCTGNQFPILRSIKYNL